MIDCLQKVEDGLKRGPWLAGRDFSLADIAIIPFVDRIRKSASRFCGTGEVAEVSRLVRANEEPAEFDRNFCIPG